MKRLLKIAAFLCLPAILSCGGQDRPVNVVLVGIDTLRPDHLGCYGYERETSPEIDRFAETGVLFESATSQAPWTTPSFATVLTSLYPSQHGSMHVETRVRSTVPTLATLLKEHGYATGAVINAPALKPEFGLARGFDFYDMTPREGRVGDGTTRDALRWIDANRGGPFLIFVHYFDPHLPYQPPPEYQNLFSRGYEGPIKNPFDIDQFSRQRDKLFEELMELAPADRAEIVNLYDGEIAFVDRAFGDLLKGIEDRGLRKNTVIILLSDHGEEFFEHGGFEHGHTLYEEQIHVPLIISFPGKYGEGVRIRNLVRLLDVTPTIFDMLGLDEESHFEGVSLVPYLTGEGSVGPAADKILPPQMAFSEALRHGPEKKALTAMPHKLIYDVRTADKEMYDLKSDPGENRNLLAACYGGPANVDFPASGSLGLLENALYKTLYAVDETWYVEMNGGGKPHVFDLEIKSQRGLSAGRIHLVREVGEDGGLLEIEGNAAAAPEENRLVLRDLEVKNRVLLAFKATPANIPVSFDIKMDGGNAAPHIYLGAELEKPGGMPFTQKASREKAKARGEPGRRPEPPYIVVWFSEPSFSGESGFTLSDETRKELRSLGYIQ
jgi:arylsulfatase A-like enzyme